MTLCPSVATKSIAFSGHQLFKNGFGTREVIEEEDTYQGMRGS